MLREPRNVREAMALLAVHDQQVREFYEDPITATCGCCDDFQRDFDIRERQLAAFIMRRSPQGSRRYEFAFSRLEKFMP